MTDVDLGLLALQSRVLTAWELREVSGRANCQGITRDCKKAAIGQGLIWCRAWVDEKETGPGHHHRLFAAAEDPLAGMLRIIQRVPMPMGNIECFDAKGGPMGTWEDLKRRGATTTDPEAIALLKEACDIGGGKRSTSQRPAVAAASSAMVNRSADAGLGPLFK